jgi:hypothetical protein
MSNSLHGGQNAVRSLLADLYIVKGVCYGELGRRTRSPAIHKTTTWSIVLSVLMIAAVVWEILLGILYGGVGFYLLARPGAGLWSPRAGSWRNGRRRLCRSPC